MLIEKVEGCINGDLVIDNESYSFLTEEQKQNVWIHVLEALEEKYSETNCYNLIDWFVTTFGDYEFLYHCDQCGDDVEEYKIEI